MKKLEYAYYYMIPRRGERKDIGDWGESVLYFY